MKVGLGLEILKSGQGGLIFLYLLSRWFLLSLILFTYSPQRPPSHYLRFQREKNTSGFSHLMTTTHWSWMQKMLDILTDISPIQLSSTFAEHYWPHIVPISLPLAQVFLTRQWSKISTSIFCTYINWFVIFQTTVTASAHLTVSITLERYFAVVHPLSHFHRR